MTERTFQVILAALLFYGFAACWLSAYRWSKHND